MKCEVVDGWKQVKLACECKICDCCEEPYCAECEAHYAECGCPGPHQDDEYEYEEVDGVLWARRLDYGGNTQ